ncbi:VirK family protein [Bradyrhizobium sp. B097]|uniref:VirK family protein n=1 Tax=Bradyrhizobium sp. B097 TaxID=3140244 RepID=UPI0031844CFF
MPFSGRHLLFVVSLLAATNVSTIAKADEPSPKYDAVLSALRSSSNVKLLLDLSRCTTVEGGKPGPPLQGGLMIRSFGVTAQHGIIFADVHQTLDSLGHPVTEYIHHSLSRDGKLTVQAATLAQGAAEVEDQGKFVCELPDGARFVW